MYLVIPAIGIRIVYKLKKLSIAPSAVSCTVTSNMVKMMQDTAVDNFFNLYTMRMPIAEIADCK